MNADGATLKVGCNEIVSGEVSCPKATLILCCLCGTPIDSISGNTCISCLCNEVDISEDLPKQCNIIFCNGCERYLLPPSTWVVCSLESRELLRICLSKLKGLSKYTLVNAAFLWTEPHSKRLKVKVTVQKEVLNSTILQQVLVVNYIIQNQMCNECHRREAKDFWRAVVQLRQKVTHRRTFLYLEQLILKHKLHSSALKIKESRDGLDFFYSSKQTARKMVDFLGINVPCRMKTSQELVSHDIHNNKYQYKHTFSIELVPVSKNDLVCLPLKLAQSLGGIGQVLLCNRVTSFLQFVDPNTLQVAEILPSVYWKSPFNSLFDYKDLKEFYILHIEKAELKDIRKKFKGCLSDAWIVPIEDLGRDEKQLHCRTHLGHILKVGDVALGYNLSSANLNDSSLESMKPADIPNIVLVKKSYGDKQKRHKLRNWKLQSLDREIDLIPTSSDENDYTLFLEEIEEDKDFRENIDIYHDSSYGKDIVDQRSDLPAIHLEEMIQEMSLQDQDQT